MVFLPDKRAYGKQVSQDASKERENRREHSERGRMAATGLLHDQADRKTETDRHEADLKMGANRDESPDDRGHQRGDEPGDSPEDHAFAAQFAAG